MVRDQFWRQYSLLLKWIIIVTSWSEDFSRKILTSEQSTPCLPVFMRSCSVLIHVEPRTPHLMYLFRELHFSSKKWWLKKGTDLFFASPFRVQAQAQPQPKRVTTRGVNTACRENTFFGYLRSGIRSISIFKVFSTGGVNAPGTGSTIYALYAH